MFDVLTQFLLRCIELFFVRSGDKALDGWSV